jgi:antirestriction protein ArdC
MAASKTANKTTAAKRTSRKAGPAKESSLAEIDWAATLVEALEAPGAMGRTYTRFYNYSFLNQIRLMMQGLFEPVATFKRWQELGYQVQKGSKAKTVLAPVLITKRDKETGAPVLDKNGNTQRILVGFKDSRTVFGFSDTDGEELPPLDVAHDAWNTDTALAALKVSREKFKLSDGNTQGYSYENEKKGKVIAINPAAVYPTKTLFHELAHLVLGHCKGLDDGKPVCERHIAEVQAEAVAYLVAKELELVDWAPAESRAYIQGWLRGDDVEEKAIAQIFSAVNKILVAGKPVKQDDDK